jgi:hypothetical protein
MKLNRILRNQEGASPGGGTTPIAPVDPAAQTGTQAAAPAIPVDALKGVVTEVMAAMMPDLRNGLFADFRKAGAFKQEKSAEPSNGTTASTQTPGAPTAAAGLSMADVEAMLERERVITARATKHDLSDAQIRRMKSALAGVPADQFASEADAFLSDLGLVKAPTAPQQAQAPAIPFAPAQAPISDKGSPAPGGVLDWEREYAENPIGMSPAARQRMDAKYGVEKARAMRLEAARAQAERIKVTRPQG